MITFHGQSLGSPCTIPRKSFRNPLQMQFFCLAQMFVSLSHMPSGSTHRAPWYYDGGRETMIDALASPSGPRVHQPWPDCTHLARAIWLAWPGFTRSARGAARDRSESSRPARLGGPGFGVTLALSGPRLGFDQSRLARCTASALPAVDQSLSCTVDRRDSRGDEMRPANRP